MRGVGRGPAPREIRFRARDGLELAAWEWGDPASEALPVLCLPGISRTGLDFEGIAARHAGERRVVALDYAGHGASARAEDAGRYRPEAALRDVLDAQAALHLHRFALVGTSMGGLLAMALSALRPVPLAAAVLNDIGPEIGATARSGVRDFLGTDPGFASLDEAVAFLQERLGPLSHDAAGWRRFAELTYARGGDGRLHPRWDTRIGEAAIGGGGGLPDLWGFFGGLAAVPLLLVWGEASDLLTGGTVEKMRRARPDMAVVSVPGCGHTPSLDEPGVAAVLDPFLRAAA